MYLLPASSILSKQIIWIIVRLNITLSQSKDNRTIVLMICTQPNPDIFGIKILFSNSNLQPIRSIYFILAFLFGLASLFVLFSVGLVKGDSPVGLMGKIMDICISLPANLGSACTGFKNLRKFYSWFGLVGLASSKAIHQSVCGCTPVLTLTVSKSNCPAEISVS